MNILPELSQRIKVNLCHAVLALADLLGYQVPVGCCPEYGQIPLLELRVDYLERDQDYGRCSEIPLSCPL